MDEVNPNEQEHDLYRPEAATAQPATSVAAGQPVTADEEPIVWTAYEYIDRKKPAGWSLLWILGSVIAAAIVWLLTRDLFPAGAVGVGVLLLGVYGARKPRQLTYMLDSHGLTIGDHHFAFSEFRSFATAPDDAFLSIELMPLRRFAMYTTLYVDPKDEEKIISRLSTHLPMQEVRTSLTDDLMRRIHF